MDPAWLDQIQVNFNPENLLAVNAVIGLMMLGVSLDLRTDDFRRALLSPKALAAGLAAQLVLLPMLTYLLARLLKPQPSVALGMLLLASCPGSNLSNILSYLAGGNAALSILMTACSSLAAILMTPFNLSLWGTLYPGASSILHPIGVDPLKIFMSILMIVGFPLTLGLTLSRIFPGLPDLIRRPFKVLSTLAFVAFACIWLKANWGNFLAVPGIVFFAVLLNAALAFAVGYASGRSARLKNADLRAVCIGVGIQNTALALILAFNFFEDLGGMALVAVGWGIWQVVLGLLLALLFATSSRRQSTERYSIKRLTHE